MNPKGTTGNNNERPANPFKIYGTWKSEAGNWEMREEGQKAEDLKRPLSLILVDAFFSIKGGNFGRTEVYSRPCYRETAQIVKVWEKDNASGKSALIAEGPVSSIYPKINKENNARKSLYLYCYAPAMKKLIAIELSGYAISPFLDVQNDMAENPGFTIQIEGVELPKDKRFNPKKAAFAPIFTTWQQWDETTIQNAIEAFQVSGADLYTLYQLGEDWKAYQQAKDGQTSEGPQAEEETSEAPQAEEKAGKSGADPF